MVTSALAMPRRAGDPRLPAAVVPPAVTPASPRPRVALPGRPSLNPGICPGEGCGTAALDVPEGSHEGSVLRLMAEDLDERQEPLARVCVRDFVWLEFHPWEGRRCGRCGARR